MDGLIKDISKLRTNYETCQKELVDVKQMNSVLKTEISSMEDLNARNQEPLAKEIQSLKEKLENSKKLLEQKDSEIKKLNYKIVNIETPNNRFPKLVMKDEYNKKDTSIIYFEATAFRLKEDSYVYDSVNGQKIEIWSKDTSFTSYMKKEGWIKITGYFIDKVWVSSNDKHLWVKESSTKEH